jgi:hypothetical protein
VKREASDVKRQTSSTTAVFHVSRCTFSDALLALAAAAFALALYLRTLAPSLLAGDSGEFQFAAWLGGFAHPTGYPLYLILGWLWTHLLPLHDPAWRMNAFSALWGGVATGLVYLLALRMLRQVTENPWPRIPAFFAALTFAVTPTLWSQATLAEVYTLNAVLIAVILLGLVTWGQTGSRRALYVTALLYGLSLTHHRTTLLYLPAIALFVWLVYRQRATAHRVTLTQRDATRLPRRLVTLALLVLAPLLFYLIIPLRAPHVPYFQIRVAADQVLQLYRTTPAGFIEHISGQGFGSALGAGGIAVARLRGLPVLFAAELTVAGLALGLLGLIGLAVCARPLLALTGLSFLAIISFNLIYGIGDIYGYYIPAYLIWVLWMALGLGTICDAVMGRRGDTGTRGHRDAGMSPRHWLALAFCLVALALPIYLLVNNFNAHDRSHDATAQAWDALLAQPIPQNAILVTNDRDEMMPQWYLKYVEDRRADLTGLFPLIQPDPKWADVGGVTDQALRSGRPVYLIKPMAGLEVKFDLTPEGALVRVDGPAAVPAARPAGQTFGDAIRLAGYDVIRDALKSGGAAEISLQWQPIARLGADYTTFIHLVNANGDKIAQSDHQPGGAYYPTSLWKPGETLVDRHTLALPADLGPGPYTIVVGLYDAALQHLGEPQEVGVVSE